MRRRTGEGGGALTKAQANGESDGEGSTAAPARAKTYRRSFSTRS